VEFNADEIGDEPYGHNFQNTDLVAALREKARQTDSLELSGNEVKSVRIKSSGVTLVDTAECIRRIGLVVAADGRNSMCRKAAGINVTTTRLPQTALAFNISHTRPHDNISTEFHRPHGPLTFVPLPADRSSVVWVESPDAAKRLLEMDRSEFREELQEKSYGILGEITEIGPIGSFPLSHLGADTLAQNRTVLVGEAGHVVPPIGAQGLNLGFRDAAAIADLVQTARTNGLTAYDDSVLSAYNKNRKSDISSRSKFVELLNRSVLSDFLPVQAARGVGLYALTKSNPLRRLAMKTGIGPIRDQKSQVNQVSESN
ncbi:MAG: FAD-dependent monooxygenase, partial [Fimbriimonadaceae bacterium]|nr:FAD-dependent monooxygenase [Alphaproteobacteria bacterium]